MLPLQLFFASGRPRPAPDRKLAFRSGPPRLDAQDPQDPLHGYVAQRAALPPPREVDVGDDGADLEASAAAGTGLDVDVEGSSPRHFEVAA